jgi:glycosyltransferase involved in cell wall biosynthesis
MMSPSDGARVLLVASWAPPSVGGPENLFNILSQARAGSFSTVTIFNDLIAGPSASGSWLPCDYFFPDHLPIPAGDLPEEEKRRILDAKAPPGASSPPVALLKRLLKPFRIVQFLFFTWKFFRDALGLYRTAMKTVAAKSPTEILGLSDTGPAMVASYLASRSSGIPLVYYLFDLYRGAGFESPVMRWVADRYEERMFRGARVVLVTNDGVKEYYERLYPHLKGRFRVVHNAIRPEGFERHVTPYRPHPPYTLLFTGRVYWAQERAVLNLIRAMDLLQDEPITLKLYVPFPEPPLLNAAKGKWNVQLLSAHQSAMPQIQTSADVLILPLAFASKAPDIINTATPGKLGSYLGSGRPILVYAPPEAYLCRYARENGFAEVVDTEDPKALRDAVLGILHDLPRAEEMIRRAGDLFRRDYDVRSTVKGALELLGIPGSQAG